MTKAQDDATALALRVREEIARRRLSRQAVADMAKVSLSTLEKALSGRRPFTLPTIVRLEEAFGMALRTPGRSAAGQAAPGQSIGGRDAGGTGGNGSAPDELGNYNRAAVSWLEGPHLTIRPSFGDAKAVYAYRTDITWDDSTHRLRFREAERVDRDYVQFGDVAVPHQSGHIYLVTNRHGQHRMIVVSRPIITGEMHGLLITLQAGRGAHLAPIATPIVLRPIVKGETPSFGKIGPGHDDYAAYARLVRKTTLEHFATLIPAV